MIRISAPGSVLFAGEYAILEEGGLGLGIAVDRRVTAVVRESDRLVIEGSNGLERFVWREDGHNNDPFLSRLIESLLMGRKNPSSAPRIHVKIDSSELYYSDHRKRGLGSSAATTAILTTALAHCETTVPNRDELFLRAVRAHRHAQGGLGSGYDCAVSMYGGVISFVGGLNPKICRISPCIPPFSLVPNSIAQSTRGAVKKYLQWRATAGKQFDEWLTNNNECVEKLSTSERAEDFIAALGDSKEIGMRIGKCIGVSAEVAPQSGLTFCKASGAGDELCIVIGETRREGYETIAETGIGWNGTLNLTQS